MCEKVESKARTTYNEVADDLVNELATSEIALEGFQFDEKNIRRRVYDAINVLMAMDIIRKEKKEIIWQGFPASSGTNIDRLRAERTNRIREVEAKQEALQVRRRRRAGQALGATDRTEGTQLTARQRRAWEVRLPGKGMRTPPGQLQRPDFVGGGGIVRYYTT